ncbi:hypothetical protein KTR10_01405 [Candidatus Kaiserbacteria bacterium]|nr:hypothetical protein [Candidatus Kaiserbacteria bacterium]
MEFTFKSLFSKGQKPEDSDAVYSMNETIAQAGGLHFIVQTDEEGWSAQCQEFESIITGGQNPNPSDEEIGEHIRDAIHTAFHIEVTEESDTQRPVAKFFREAGVVAV